MKKMNIKLYFKNLLKNILKAEAVIKSLSFLIFLYSKFAGATSKWVLTGFDRAMETADKSNVIWVGWHARATMMPYFWNKFVKRRMSALTSPHQDGQIIANFLKWYNIEPVSGSTNEKARQGALEMLRDLMDGADLFVSPDGPRGPRMRMKKSPIYFAQKTGKPIICVCFSSNRALVIEKAWDKTMIALPFGNGVLGFSKPMYVPKELSEEEFEKTRIELENMANELSEKCDKMVGRKPILPASEFEFKKKREWHVH